MPKNLSVHQQRELEEIFARCQVILDAFRSRPDTAAVAIEMSSAIEEAYSLRQLSGLRMVERDLREWSQALDSEERALLEAALRHLQRGSKPQSADG